MRRFFFKEASPAGAAGGDPVLNDGSIIYTQLRRATSPFITASGAPPWYTPSTLCIAHTQEEEEEEDPLLLDGASVIP
ncbi:Uncharacterized protein APZ42_028828 [Daphnia magna]|uniref:Uncharacterized protein n=1 Tax=Daphnia magna TaxID=35525 RepID=A0A164Q5A2_9CRUS|nr:Uncharacterized protein APZ42_028828 [Daphnia magna]